LIYKNKDAMYVRCIQQPFFVMLNFLVLLPCYTLLFILALLIASRIVKLLLHSCTMHNPTYHFHYFVTSVLFQMHKRKIILKFHMKINVIILKSASIHADAYVLIYSSYIFHCNFELCNCLELILT